MVTYITRCSDMFIVSKVLIAVYLIAAVWFLYDTSKDDYNDRKK